MQDGTGRTGKAVEHAVRAEHRRLDELFAEVAEAFQEPEDVEEIRDVFAALHEELDVHFDQEDRLYYATIGALRPDLKPELEAFAEGHRGFRLELAALADQLGRGDVASARSGFESLRTSFEQHEIAEENVLERVDRGTAEAR